MHSVSISVIQPTTVLTESVSQWSSLLQYWLSQYLTDPSYYSTGWVSISLIHPTTVLTESVSHWSILLQYSLSQYLSDPSYYSTHWVSISVIHRITVLAESVSQWSILLQYSLSQYHSDPSYYSTGWVSISVIQPTTVRHGTLAFLSTSRLVTQFPPSAPPWPTYWQWPGHSLVRRVSKTLNKLKPLAAVVSLNKDWPLDAWAAAGKTSG